MDVLWYIPSHGDSRYLGSVDGARVMTFDYGRQIALALEGLGYFGALIPAGRSCEDPWVLAASLIGFTRELRFLVALRPGALHPALAARMTSTMDRLSNGRLLVNFVAGGDAAELEGDGQFLDHADRYRASDEFINIWSELLQKSTGDESISFKGDFFNVKKGKLLFPSVQSPRPPLYFSGSSEAAHDLAARRSDVYLTWGEPPAGVAEKIQDLKTRAERHGRKLRFGVRLHIIVRDSEKEAWQAADKLISRLDDDAIARAQETLQSMDSVGQSRMNRLRKGIGRSRSELEVSPNLWAGVGLTRGGAGTALVGNPDQVAEKIREYEALGADIFVLSGYPHLEEAHRVAELLFPRLGISAPQRLPGQALTGPFASIGASTRQPVAAE